MANQTSAHSLTFCRIRYHPILAMRAVSPSILKQIFHAAAAWSYSMDWTKYPTDQEFRAVVNAIESLAVMYSRNQFIVTSRIAGWRSGVGADFQVFYVKDLSEKQTDTFIDTWYHAVERNAVIGPLKEEGVAQRAAREQRSEQRATDLKNTLKENIGIRRLAVNPMLLSIIALVHRSLATLPKERSKLYDQCSKILLEQWDISRGVHVDDTNLKLDQKETIMRRLAYAYHTGEIGDKGGAKEASFVSLDVVASVLPSVGKEATDADRLLKRLVERSGVLAERRRGVLTFSHLTFQEGPHRQIFGGRRIGGKSGLFVASGHPAVRLVARGYLIICGSYSLAPAIYQPNTSHFIRRSLPAKTSARWDVCRGGRYNS